MPMSSGASNPLMAPSSAKESIPKDYKGIPIARFTLDGSAYRALKSGSFTPLDAHPKFTQMPSIMAPAGYSVDGRLEKGGMVITQSGPIQVRPASAYGAHSARVVLERLPKEGRLSGLFSEQSVREGMEKKVYASAGIEGSLNRLFQYSPTEKGGLGDLRVPSREEVFAALGRCGQLIPEGSLVFPKPLQSTESASGVKYNAHASNGIIGGTMSMELPRNVVLAEASTTLRELEKFKSAEEVDRYYQHLIEREPWRVGVLGKTKADYISVQKVKEGKLRFYSVLNRPQVMVMQTVTQVYEEGCENVFNNSDLSSAQGVSFVRGGAERMVQALEYQLEQDTYAFLHVGDDSFVVWLEGESVVVFTVDCTAFDLTQRSDITEPVHDMMYEELAKISLPSARLWWNYMRKRLVVLNNGKTYLMRNGGPSGTPMQSKVNDVLMDIMLTRLGVKLRRRRLNDLERTVEEVGRTMGFTVRLEQKAVGPSLRQVLRDSPVLFIGYYLWADEEGAVWPYMDVHRSLAQRPYPANKWETKDVSFLQKEAMRLTSIVANAGLPPPELAAAHDAQRKHAVELLREALAAHGDVKDKRLDWFVQGMEALRDVNEIPSMSGLLGFMERGGDRELWLPEKPLESVSEFLYGDAMAEMMAKDRYPFEPSVPKPPPRLLPKPQPVMAMPTAANHGRPPAKLRFAPLPPKLPPAPQLEPVRKKGRGRRGGKRGLEELLDERYALTPEQERQLEEQY